MFATVFWLVLEQAACGFFGVGFCMVLWVSVGFL